MRRNREDSRKMREEVITMTEEGAPASVIAEELGISLPYVYTILSTEGIPAIPKPNDRSLSKRLTEEQLQKLVIAYASGDPMANMLDEYNLNYHQMYAILRKQEIPLRKVIDERKEARDAAVEAAVMLYEQGVSLWQIRSETGVSQPALMKALRGKGKLPNRLKLKEVGKLVALPGHIYDPDPDPEG